VNAPDRIGSAHLDRGYALLQTGDPADTSEAIEALETATRLLPGNELEAAANDQLGRALIRVDRFDEARERLLVALETAKAGERRLSVLGNLAALEARPERPRAGRWSSAAR